MRLTFKDINPFNKKEQYYPQSVKDDDKGNKYIDFTVQDQCMNKLGQLEDIEEEFHIDLINRVCFFKTAGEEIMKVNVIGIGFRDGILVVETEQKKNVFALKQEDYGKTWALTKEELL